MDPAKAKILVVDDTKTNVEVLEGILMDEYDVHVALDGERAIKLIPRLKPDLILLDVMMPVMDGYETLRRLRLIEEGKDIPVIFLTAKADSEGEKEGLSLGAVDYITKPFAPSLVKLRIKNQLEYKFHRDHLTELVHERTLSLRQTLKVMLMSLGALAEYRDNETGGHIRRTQIIVRMLAEVLQKNPKFYNVLPNDEVVEQFATAAPLHDIGKVGIQDSILRKPGRLTSEEMDQMKEHTILGYEVLESATFELHNDPMVIVAAQIAKSHHEKWDGTGYPEGLKGEEIPIGARLMAVADVYDALVSKRVYKEPLPHEDAVNIILEGCDTHFDPDIVNAFKEIADKLPGIYKDFTD